ncbi:replication initiator [Streptomyces sp. NPDC050508]|uniref:replication initiator n=1 Tax=Streptomyces sp. NPDC050508 TaxID=3155405 RepID=UPI0034343C91
MQVRRLLGRGLAPQAEQVRGDDRHDGHVLVQGAVAPVAVAVEPPCPGSDTQRCRVVASDRGDYSIRSVNAPGDELIGQPLCGGCYDAHAGKLWHRFADVMRRQELPRAAGVTRAEFGRTVRVSFVKVTEYQRRGLVHFHAVVRLDPAKDVEELPFWADTDVIASAVHWSVRRVHLLTPYSPAGEWGLTWGAQVDVQPIPGSLPDASPNGGVSADKVAAYIAKYVTKDAEITGTVDRPLYCSTCRGTGLAGACSRCDGSGLRMPLDSLRVPRHARALISTAWRLGALPEYRRLNLRRWAHQFGFGGHFTTKSRSYSTTMSALRKARADFRAEKTRTSLGVTGELIVESEMSFSHTGYADEIEEQIAGGIRDEIAENRILTREALADLRAEEEARWWA